MLQFLKSVLWLKIVKIEYKIILICCWCNCCVLTSMFQFSSNYYFIWGKTETQMFGHKNYINSKLKYKTTQDFLQEAKKQRYRWDSNKITSTGNYPSYISWTKTGFTSIQMVRSQTRTEIQEQKFILNCSASIGHLDNMALQDDDDDDTILQNAGNQLHIVTFNKTQIFKGY